MSDPNEKVLIYAGDGRCYWMARGCGYTCAKYAGIYTREEAIALTKHCGPEKRIELHPVPEDHIPTLKARVSTLQRALEICHSDWVEALVTRLYQLPNGLFVILGRPDVEKALSDIAIALSPSLASGTIREIRTVRPVIQDCAAALAKSNVALWREKAGILDFILRDLRHFAKADLGQNEDGHFVRFTLEFDVPEPKDWPNYESEEWTEEQLLAALRAVTGEGR